MDSLGGPAGGATATQRPDSLVETLRSTDSWRRLWRGWVAVAPILAICGLWMLMHPYMGVVHDARLYVAQAFNVLQPEIFGHDLFFAFGSQDEFTLFTKIVAPMVGQFGFPFTSLLLVTLGQALWLSGAIALATRVAGNYRTAILLLVPVAILPPEYAGFGVLGFGEPYMTPRVFAEAGVLWALTFLVLGRYWASAVLILAAALLHPLMAATGIAAGFIYLLQGDRRWAWLGLAGVLAIIGLAFAGIAPFDRLFQTMDADWLEVVEQRNTYLFPSLWPQEDWSKLILHVSVWAGAVALSSGTPRRLLIAAGMSGLLGLAAMVIGGDLLHNLFVIQVQPYRAAWLLHLLGLMSLGLLLLRLWHNKSNAEPIAAFFLLAWLICHTFSPWFGAAMAILATLLTIRQDRLALAPVNERLCAAILVSGIIIVLGLFGLRVAAMWQRVFSPLIDAGEPFLDRLNFSVIEVALVATIVYLLFKRFPSGMRRAMPVLAGIVLVLGVSLWDKRGPWQSGIENGFDAAALQAQIPESAQVYWERDNRGAWMVLRRASYVSSTQGAGIAFSRPTALEYRDRTDRLQPLMQREVIDIFRNKQKAVADLPPLTPELLKTACHRAPELDFMILSRRVDGKFIAQWRASAPYREIDAMLLGVKRDPVYDFYLYDCALLRGGPIAQTANGG